MLKRLIVGAALLATLTAGFSATGVAHADVWEDVGGVVNSLVGPRTCSLSASSPTLTAGTVRASASVSCNRTLDEVEVEVCIQVRQAVVSETVTWVNHACSANAKPRASFVGATAMGPCLVGTWNYRTVASGGGYGGGETPWTGVFVSSPVSYTCGIQ
jgi:hypothetical protein